MRPIPLLFLLVFSGAAHADWANVAKASEVLDFNLPRTEKPAGQSGLVALDIDGDGQVSRAEAAGNETITVGFDRADRNRDGRLTTAEWERYEKWQERRAKAREARLARAKAKESAAAGASAGKAPRKPARAP